MESLSGLLAFARTAETLSFVKTGRRLGISPSAAGKSVARLEHQLGVRLLHRSTRRLALTAEGTLFFERCRRILDDLDDAQAMLAQTLEVPRGRLRVSLPTIGYRFLVPHLQDFRRLYPEIDIDLDFNDQIVDVIGDGFDAAIRSGVLPDSRLMARKLGSFRFVLVAARTYIDIHGTPTHADALEHHACLHFRFQTSGRLQDWILHGKAFESVARHPPAFVCNNVEALLAAAIAGLGIAHVPDFLAAEALADGRLVSLLDDCFVDEGQFWLLWPSGRQLSPKVRAFVDFACERLFKEPAKVMK